MSWGKALKEPVVEALDPGSRLTGKVEHTQRSHWLRKVDTAESGCLSRLLLS